MENKKEAELNKSALDSVNLLPQERLTEEPVNKFLDWANTAGRMIVVLTEALVLIVFFARFRIDTQILDLKQEITAKTQLLQSLETFEQEFKALKLRAQIAQNLNSKFYSPNPTLGLIEKNIPAEVFLQTLQISPQKVTLEGAASSYKDISNFWQNLKKEKEAFGEVNLLSLGRQETKEDEENKGVITFTLQINPI